MEDVGILRVIACSTPPLRTNVIAATFCWEWLPGVVKAIERGAAQHQSVVSGDIIIN